MPDTKMIEPINFTAEMDIHLGGLLGSILYSYTNKEEADREHEKIRAAIEHDTVNIVFHHSMDETARRRAIAHFNSMRLQDERSKIRTLNVDVAEKIDAMLYYAMKVDEYVFGMGEHPVTVMLKSRRSDYLKEKNSKGGTTGSKTRIKWRDDARARYDDYVVKNPHIKFATDIARGIRKMGPTPGWPKEKQVTAVILRWQRP